LVDFQSGLAAPEFIFKEKVHKLAKLQRNFNL